MTDTAETPETPDIPRTADGRFAPGAPGRPAGAYGRASRRAAMALLAHFEAHQAEMIAELKSNPAQYWRMMSQVMPRRAEAGLSDPAAWTEVEAARLIRQAQDLLAYNYGFNREAVAGLDALLERGEGKP